MNGKSGENAYTILETLHKSRRYSVYKAKNYFTGQLVTIKTNSQRWLNDPLLLQQMKIEADTGTKLQHPSIRKTLGFFTDGPAVFIVSEYVEGVSLGNLLNTAKLDISFEHAQKWTLQLLDALDHAHALEIRHLNLNPDHVLISTRSELFLFGFGKNASEWKYAESDQGRLHPVLFTAPELFKGLSADQRADLYSLGVLAFILFYGQQPWAPDKHETPTLYKQRTFQPPVIDPELPRGRLPHYLYTILNKCLMIDPELRFGSAAEVREALLAQTEIPFQSCLTRYLAEPPSPPPPPVLETPEQAPPAAVGQNSEPVSEQLEILITPEPEPLPEQYAPLEDDEFLPPEPVPEPEPVKPAPTWIPPVTEPEPEPIKRAAAWVPPVTEPKPPTRKTQPPEPSQAIDAVQEPAAKSAPFGTPTAPEISRMKHWWSILKVASLLIILYIIVKYVIISDKPKFTKLDQTEVANKMDEGFQVRNQPLELVAISGGTAITGQLGEDGEEDEFPPRELQLSSFMIGVHEVTAKEWAMATPGFVVDGDGEDLPVVNVTFYDVLEYCNEKSRKDGLKPCYEFFGDSVTCDFSAKGYRLPTEAEWEYAAREASKELNFRYSGSNDPDAVGWHSANSDGRIHPIRKREPNSLGLYDMSGNAAEWVWNWYSGYSSLSKLPHTGPDSGTDKVFRGGSWFQPASDMRVTNRDHAKPLIQKNYLGFRVARSK